MQLPVDVHVYKSNEPWEISRLAVYNRPSAYCLEARYWRLIIPYATLRDKQRNKTDIDTDTYSHTHTHTKITQIRPTTPDFFTTAFLKTLTEQKAHRPAYCTLCVLEGTMLLKAPTGRLGMSIWCKNNFIACDMYIIDVCVMMDWWIFGSRFAVTNRNKKLSRLRRDWPNYTFSKVR